MADISCKSKKEQGEQPATATSTSLINSTISIDSQSFVNLGQLIGSRGHDLTDSTMAASGRNSDEKLGASASFLSGGGSDSDPESLKDFAQFFHPMPSTATAAANWSSYDLCHGGEETGEVRQDDDDNDSVLPALPRTPSPVSLIESDHFRKQTRTDWITDDIKTVNSDDDRAEMSSDEEEVEDALEHHPSCPTVLEAAAAAAAAGGAMGYGASSCVSVPSLRESWLHVPMDDISKCDPTSTSSDDCGHSIVIAAGVQEHAHQHDADTKEQEEVVATAEGGSPPDGCVARDDCGCCFACMLDNVIALARPRFERLSKFAKRPIGEVGAEAYVKAQEVCSRGQAAVTQAVDSVPQAPGV